LTNITKSGISAYFVDSAAGRAILVFNYFVYQSGQSLWDRFRIGADDLSPKGGSGLEKKRGVLAHLYPRLPNVRSRGRAKSVKQSLEAQAYGTAGRNAKM